MPRVSEREKRLCQTCGGAGKLLARVNRTKCRRCAGSGKQGPLIYMTGYESSVIDFMSRLSDRFWIEDWKTLKGTVTKPVANIIEEQRAQQQKRRRK